MVDVQSSFGKIKFFHEGGGGEVAVGSTIAAPLDFGDYKLIGDLAETDTGAITVSKINGVLRLSGNDEDGKGAALATEAIFTPASNGPLVCEARVELAAITARNAFVGFCGTAADDVAPPATGSTATLTLTATNTAGFVFDSRLTDTDWHGVYAGGATTGPTASTSVDLGVAPVATEFDVLRVEIDPNGTVSWYINGDRVQRVAGAASTSALFAGLCGVWGTTTTAADIDVDYFAVEGNRNWAR